MELTRKEEIKEKITRIFKIAISPINAIFRKKYSTFQRRKINRKPEIENRKSMKGGRRTSLGQNPPGTIARYECNIQLIVYHGATIAVVGRLRAWPKPPFVGQRWYYDRVRWVLYPPFSRGHTPLSPFRDTIVFHPPCGPPNPPPNNATHATNQPNLLIA